MYSPQFHSVRQVDGFEAWWDALVAVEAGAAFLGFDLEALTAEFAGAGVCHIGFVTLSLGLMVCIRLRVAGSIAV